MHNIPVIAEPFSRIVIDIVGPLPVCCDTESRLILTIVDHCTHFPEALLLITHEAVDMAKARVSVFSHFGYARQILSNCCSEFISQLTKVFFGGIFALSTFVLVHIILLLLKDSWLETPIASNLKSAVEFVLDRRERLRLSITHAQQHAEEQKNKSKDWYDKKLAVDFSNRVKKFLLCYVYLVIRCKPNIVYRTQFLTNLVLLII